MLGLKCCASSRLESNRREIITERGQSYVSRLPSYSNNLSTSPTMSLRLTLPVPRPLKERYSYMGSSPDKMCEISKGGYKYNTLQPAKKYTKKLGYLSQLVQVATQKQSPSLFPLLFTAQIWKLDGGTVGCVLTLFQNNAAEFCKVLCCIQETELEFLNTMGAWNRLVIGFSYRPAMLRRLAEFILV